MIMDSTNLQYLSDASGIKTAVVIPIKEWEAIENEMNYSVPEWQKEIVRERAKTEPENGSSWKGVKAKLLKAN